MATKPTTISDEAIQKATGKTWDQWYRILAEKRAETMPHKEIAEWLHDEQQVPPWWCQMLTVKFEQVIGRRKPGEVGKGEYSVGVSVTQPLSIDEAMAWWLDKVKSEKDFNGIRPKEEPRVSQTPKWRYWRVKLADGSVVYVNITEKASGKASIQVTQEKLADEQAVDYWRQYWKAFLN
jgi:hypothetical protein